MAKKKVNYQLIPTSDKAYDLLSMARETWHVELGQAHIALAWRKDTKADKEHAKKAMDHLGDLLNDMDARPGDDEWVDDTFQEVSSALWIAERRKGNDGQ